MAIPRVVIPVKQTVSQLRKRHILLFCHFGLDPESSHFSSFWTPAPVPYPDAGFVEVTGLELFTKQSKLVSH
jgi:hypothetical protein